MREESSIRAVKWEGCLWAFSLQQVANWSHLVTPTVRLSVHKALENSGLDRNTKTKTISSKTVFSPLDLPFWIKINLIHEINLP